MKKFITTTLTTIVLLGGLVLALSGFASNGSAITSPDEDGIVFETLNLEATYVDEDTNEDPVSWAVREGTCAAGTNTVLGNVDGYNNPYSWNGSLFNATADVSAWTSGKYCFILNPQEDAGAEDVRLTRLFWIVHDDYVSGGGRLLEERSLRNDWLNISFGGAVADAGTYGLIGEWQVNFHNVNNDEFDKSKFHTTSITDLNFYTGATCVAMNFTAIGEWNHIPGYKMIFRAGDSGKPGGMDDTARFEIYNPGGTKVYDTWDGWDPSGFNSESSCVGSARTGLDNGNIKIEF